MRLAFADERASRKKRCGVSEGARGGEAVAALDVQSAVRRACVRSSLPSLVSLARLKFNCIAQRQSSLAVKLAQQACFGAGAVASRVRLGPAAAPNPSINRTFKKLRFLPAGYVQR
jgi:hypothetical protein